MKKAWFILIPLAVIVIGAMLIIILVANRSSDSRSTDLATLRNLEPEKQDQRLNEMFSSGDLPSKEEADLLTWLFVNKPEKAEILVRTHHQNLSNLPKHLSDAALQLIKDKEGDAGLTAMTIARELYPNDPDVLGIIGVVAYLSGRQMEARQFLEEAESWRMGRPIVDFYLGGILIQSENTADRTRGKKLLIRVATQNDPELSELAGLTLLGNSTIPLVPNDIEMIYKVLDEHATFRPENPNLSATVLRALVDRLVPHLPEEALALADLLLRYPGATTEDRLAVVQLAISLGDQERSRYYINSIDHDTTTFPEGSSAAKQLDRIRTLQYIIEGQYDESMDLFDKLIREQGNEPALQNTFKSALQYDLPLETKQVLLAKYLEAPVFNIQTSLNILSRLIEIDPLDDKDWIRYAVVKLLPMDARQVGQWLVMVGASEAIIESLGRKERPLSKEEYLVLTNAYLQMENTEMAQETLDQAQGLLDPSVQAFLQAQVLVKENKPEEAFEYWKNAQQGALVSDKFPILKSLGFLALQMNQDLSAMQSMFTAFSAGVPFNQVESGQLLDLTLRYGTLQQSIQVAGYLAETYPDVAVYQNNLAYFKFLAEEGVEDAVKTMRELVEDYPDIHQYRLTLALGLLKEGRTNEADRLLQSTKVNWNETGNRGKLIYAVVLSATNQRVVADGLIQTLDLDDLIPEEKALLEAF